jgi:DNA polymerase (family X)
MREGRGEIAPALNGKLPQLVTDTDLRGILHCHTDASDGTGTLETMAKASGRSVAFWRRTPLNFFFAGAFF